MKKSLILFIVLLSTVLKAQPPCAFTLTPTGPFSITCTNTLILVTVAPANLSYTWTSLSEPPQNGTSASFTNTGTYTIAATGTGCSGSTQTFAVVMNTVVPSTTVSPTSQAIDCNTTSAVTFSGTCSNPTINMQHDWYSPINPLPAGPPIATTNNTLSILSGNIPPGVYTLQTTNLVTGCKTIKTITVTSLSAYPTFSIGSTTNYSVGCVPLNSTTISIINALSTQTPAGVCSFTFLPPGFGGVVTPSIVLGTNNSTATTLPGTWTVIVQDNSNFCRSILTVPIIQNTVAPNVTASVTTATLTCYNPTVLATGSSTTPFTSVTWNVPSVPPNLSTPTVVIGIPANGPNTSTNSLTYATYTVVATNSNNACQSTSVVVINQNFKPPVSSPTISIATPTAIYCKAAVAPVVLTTGNSTTTSGGGPSAFVANPCWSGPSPQTPTCGPSSYSCYVTGVYTLSVIDNYNGCPGSGTVFVADRTQPPVITNPVNSSTLDCAASAATLNLALTGTMTGGVRYLITSYPLGSSFSPTSAITVNLNPDLSGTSSNSIGVSLTGQYVWVVTNTLTGCSATGTVNVVAGGLNADLDASPPTGYAPLTVSFFNNTSSSFGTSSITSVWSFGNGSVLTTSSTAATSALYSNPGTYTVMLIATKGTCVDTAYRTVKVDAPSKMEVPNVFTPNGDGSNDVFFMKVANLKNISAVILDRWGGKVYETTSTTGNIAWDGKNFAGVECAAGVYFYIIKATGKDEVEYEQKGSVSLFR